MSDENKNPKGGDQGQGGRERPQEKPQTGTRINLHIPGESTAKQDELRKAMEIPQRPTIAKPKDDSK